MKATFRDRILEFSNLGNKHNTTQIYTVPKPEPCYKEHQLLQNGNKQFGGASQFSQHPMWVYCAEKPIENTMYSFSKIIVSNDKEFHEKI